MKRLTLRIPENIYSKLEKIQETKQHLSMNALIVEILSSEGNEKEAILSGKTQFDPAIVEACSGE